MSSKTPTSTLPTVPELMAAGAHFGHKKHRSHPAARKYVFTVRDRVLVINLEDTARQLAEACTYITERSKAGALMLFVGTKRQAADPIKVIADALDQPYVNQRWLGGTLTNFETIQKRLKRLRELEALVITEKFVEDHSKKERVVLERELKRLDRTLGGIKKLTRLPDLLMIIDTNEEANSLKEAKRMNIPVVAIVDTNASPDQVLMPIVANDDSAKTIQLILDSLKAAALSGRAAMPKIQVENPESGIENPEPTIVAAEAATAEEKPKKAAKKTAKSTATKKSTKTTK